LRVATDPFVKVSLGATSYTTKVQNNAGGSVAFHEVFAFREAGDSILKVAVYALDTISNDLLGQGEIDLRQQSCCRSVDKLRESEGVGSAFAMVDSKTGHPSGTVYLAFATVSDTPATNGTLVATKHNDAHSVFFAQGVPAQSSLSATCTPHVHDIG